MIYRRQSDIGHDVSHEVALVSQSSIFRLWLSYRAEKSRGRQLGSKFKVYNSKMAWSAVLYGTFWRLSFFHHDDGNNDNNQSSQILHRIRGGYIDTVEQAPEFRFFVTIVVDKK